MKPPTEDELPAGDLWMQIIADVTARPVFTIEQEVEAPMGAALLAAYGVGLVNGDEVRRGWVTLELRAKPRSAASASSPAWPVIVPGRRSVMGRRYRRCALSYSA